ncbi:hypothetical protein E1162_19280 [Rhodobacteraceae bacterium RKSG542]|uniref:hypothetical protein n=1 Tax=Pseudovibrio flavus TaxID=2529854 RepID=UPI0012BD7EB5|nr:hypothetical protein [Pseudovibrio flavus]MTI19390.1 hypothetical protein [Pseudovibrio flavus]
MKKTLTTSFLIFLAITAFLGISVILSGDLDETSGKILITTASTSFYSLIGLASIVHLGKKYDLLAKTGIIFCGIGLLHALYTTWFDPIDLHSIENRISLFFIGLAIGHACLMLLIDPRSRGVLALTVIAIASVVINTAIAVISVYFDPLEPIKLMGIIAIIATFATISAPALNFSIPKQ